MFSLSNYVEKTDFAFYFITAISAVLLIFITVLMLYFVFKYNSKRHTKPVNIEGNVPLEIFWTIVPIFLVGAMFYYGYIGYDELANPPADAMRVTVTGQMWKWTFKYQNGLETDTLYVPKDKAVALDLKSLDVNHSFYIPVFKFKRDVLPNKNNSIWFRATETGSHDIACAEYCGLKHWNMYTKVVVMEQAEYDAWMQSKMPAGQ